MFLTPTCMTSSIDRKYRSPEDPAPLRPGAQRTPGQCRADVRSAILSAAILRPMAPIDQHANDTPPGITAAGFVRAFEAAGQAEHAEAARTVVRLCEAVRAAGGRALLVGGSVRDVLLGGLAKDFDIEVARLTPEQVEGIARTFGSISEVGKAFSVLKLALPSGLELDVSLPRTDSSTGDGHRDFQVKSDPFLDEREAFRRRDFTINAIGADLLTGALVDPFGGVQDLRDRVLRVVDRGTFVEDPLRALRALQFLARFHLTLDPDSASLLATMGPSLRHLPRERLHGEWYKLLVLAEAPSVGLRAGMELGLYPALHPELAALVPLAHDPVWHPEGGVWEHTCQVVDVAARLARASGLDAHATWVVLLAALCHDLGKVTTTSVQADGRVHATGHEQAGADPTRSFLASLGVETAVERRVLPIVTEHMKPCQLREQERRGVRVSDGAIRRLAARVAPATIRELALVYEADKRGRGNVTEEADDGAWLIARADALQVADRRPANLIEGRDVLAALGCPPGKHVGEIVRLANDLRDDRERTREQVLAALEGIRDPAAAIAELKRLVTE